jgi:hypothetical protein
MNTSRPDILLVEDSQSDVELFMLAHQSRGGKTNCSNCSTLNFVGIACQHWFPAIRNVRKSGL